ncbi:MAG: response regulator transcription factor [Bacteroidota bacterium]
MKHILCVWLLLSTISLPAQYLIKGQAPEDYKNGWAYLDIMDSWNDFRNIAEEMILKRAKIDSSGYFEFKGNELPAELAWYRIRYMDQPDAPVYIHALKRHYVPFLFQNGDSIHLAGLWNESSRITNQNLNSLVAFVDSFTRMELDAPNDRLNRMARKRMAENLQAIVDRADDPMLKIFALAHEDEEFPLPLRLYEETEKELQEIDMLQSYLTTFQRTIGSKSYGEKGAEPSYWKTVALLSLFFNLALLVLWFRKELFSKPSQKVVAEKEVLLTDKEEEVLQLLGQKKSNKEIAQALFISEATVKTHLNHIYKKLGAKGRREAVERYLDLNSNGV